MMQEKNKDEKTMTRSNPPYVQFEKNHKNREHRWKKNNQTTAMMRRLRDVLNGEKEKD